MNLFIDTNIYLNFYHFANDDLEELKKLTVVIDKKKITLFTTEQAISEFKRNRDNKIADALKRFSEQKSPNQFPQICKEYGEFKNLEKGLKTYELAKSKIMSSLKEDIEKRTLGADIIIGELFRRATVIPLKEPYYQEALKRHNLGNPPGKNDSMGDAVNWTCLLAEAPSQEKMYLISDDKDYFSVLTDKKSCQFLVDEWAERKSSQIVFHRSLSDFFREKFPDIKLASELEKEIAINNFMNSNCFNDTDKAIRDLEKYDEFTPSEVNQILTASINNNQIYWIKEKSNVRSFLFGIAENYQKIIDIDLWNTFQETYNIEEEPEYNMIEGIPF